MVVIFWVNQNTVKHSPCYCLGMTQTTATKFRMMWNGTQWNAVELDGEIHLSRICRYCPEGSGGSVHTKHVVADVTTRQKIDERNARIGRLRSYGEDEMADELQRKAGVFL